MEFCLALSNLLAALESGLRVRRNFGSDAAIALFALSARCGRLRLAG